MASGGKNKQKRGGIGKALRGSAGFWSLLTIALLMVAYLAVIEASNPHVSGDRLRLDQLFQAADQKKLKAAELLDYDSYVVGRYVRPDGSISRYNSPYLKTQNTRERLLDVLLRDRVPLTVDQQSAKSLVLPATILLPALMLVVLMAYFILSHSRGTGLFGVRSGAQKIDAGNSSVTFADVAGQEAALIELREISQFVSDPQRFAALGVKVPKGILLFGPPGCGKTLTARALAGEAGASFYSISGSDFIELYVGVGASRVRNLFKEARESAPAIIFIDELDAVGRRRSSAAATAGGSEEQDQALNGLLAEMDGFSPMEGVVVVGATNRPDVLDPALLRPGRFDRTIGLESPDEQGRLAILSIHARGKPLAEGVDLAATAKRAVGMTGADLANVINEAGLLAARADRQDISQAELDEALQRIKEAPERQRRLAMRDRSLGQRSLSEEQVSFTDVAGQEQAVMELREISQFLSEPERFAAMGVKAPKGVLLYGPPGCGKTMLARAVAAELNAAFFSVAGSEFAEVFVGEGAARIRDLFAQARVVAPAIIFIDEIDAVGRRRSAGGARGTGSGEEQEQALNGLLAEMDGFSPTQGIVVIGATNRPDVLDPALLRPGRFDRTIGLESPDEPARLAILTVHAQGKPLAPDADLGAIAGRAVGMTGADLASVVNEAGLLAVRAGKQAISRVEFETALARIMEAPERQRRLAMRDRSLGQRSLSEEQVSFTDVAGQEAAVTELREISQFLSDPERFAAMGVKAPKGVLLYGPPGCGKTLLARAAAAESNAAFFGVAGSEFAEVLVGEGAARIRDLFAQARVVAPAIIFIDELDAVGRRRSAGGAAATGSREEQEQTLNGLLAEMDGFSQVQGVLVIGATNRPDVLDPALLRPGRFDRTIGLESPDEQSRLAILSLHARGKSLAEGVDLSVVAKRAVGMTGADLANVLNEAGMLAVRTGSSEISQAELEQALERTLEAPERQRRLAMRDRSLGQRSLAEERVSFADLAGVDEAIAELGEVRQYLEHPERFTSLGAHIPTGYLLSGPPGCGKTLLARAVAGETNAAFFAVAGSELTEVFVGEGAARVRDLFAQARAVAPAIVFIDEIDAIGARRETSLDGHREREQTLNQILIELDGFSQRGGVIVIAATNRPELLDPALVRPGRFDRHVTIDLPDRAARRAIFEVHAGGKRVASDVDLDTVAGLTRGLSGADLANVINEAALLAGRHGAQEIDMRLVEEGIERATGGIASGRIMSEKERRVVAYHEAGHGLVAMALPSGAPLHKLSIIPRGSALGSTWLPARDDRLLESRSMLVARMAVALGGRTAELIVFDEAWGGSASDLSEVGQIAHRMVCEEGMSKDMGALAYSENGGAAGRSGGLSEETARLIDFEVRALVEEAEGIARSALTASRVSLDRVAEALAERETLSLEEVERIAGPSASATAPANGGQVRDVADAHERDSVLEAGA